MRETKFRGYCKDRKVWIYFTLSDLDMGLLSIPFDELDIVVQFTGLKDKNGKEIFEGDILKYGNEEEYPKTTFSLVYWCEFQAKFMDKRKFISGGGSAGELNSWDNYLDEIKDLDFCEVIGNKFENPELLENKK